MNEVEILSFKLREMISYVNQQNGRLETATEALLSISKNSCCDQCQEAKKVALAALNKIEPMSSYVTTVKVNLE